jgi:hypothetical protein
MVRKLWVILVLTVLTAAAIPMGAAEKVAPPPFWGVPRSDTVIVAEFTSPTSHKTLVESRDGTVVTFWKKGDPYAIGFITSMIDGKPRFNPYRIFVGDQIHLGSNQITLLDPDKRLVEFGDQVNFKLKTGTFNIRALSCYQAYFPGRPPLAFVPGSGGELAPDVIESILGTAAAANGVTTDSLCCIECEGEVGCSSVGIHNSCGNCSVGALRI